MEQVRYFVTEVGGNYTRRGYGYLDGDNLVMQRFEKDANIDPSNILENVRNQCHKDILHPGRYKGIVTQCFEDYEIFDPFTQEYKTIDYFEKEYFVAYSKI